MRRVARYTAAGGVVIHGDRVLVLKRPSRAEVRLPKGHVEPGESLREAALREIREETGYASLSLRSELGTQSVEYDHGTDHVVRDEHYFLVEADANAIREASSDPSFSPIWISWAEAERALTFEAEREWVRRAHQAVSRPGPASASKVSLSTGSLFTYGIARVFEMASEAGFDGIELLVDHRWDTRDPVYLRRLSGSHGLPIIAVHAPFVPTIEGWPQGELARLRYVAALAHELNTAMVVTHLPRSAGAIQGVWLGAKPRQFSLPIPWSSERDYVRFLRDELENFEGDEGITVCVENMPACRLFGVRLNTYRYNRIEQLARFPHLVLDTTHLATWGIEPLDAYQRLGNRVTHIHLSNYDGTRHSGHRLPADGDVQLGPFLRHVVASGYQGALTLESYPANLEASDSTVCLERLRAALSFCRSNLVPEEHAR